MAITLELNSSKWIKCQSSTVEKELEKRQKQINDVLDYDICASIIFNECRNMAIVQSIYNKDIDAELDVIPHIIFLRKNQDNMLKELIDKKEIVENCHKEDCSMLNGIKSEVFIPIFNVDGLTMVLIGCIYLGSYEYKKFPSKLLSEDEQIIKNISDISKLLALSLAKIEKLSNVMDTINIFTDILKHKDYFLPNHSYNVANWCQKIGMRLGFSHEKLDKLYIAGLLHDVGKTMIDYKILNKNNKLTEEEYEIIKKHSIDGYIIAKNLLSNIPELADIPKIVRHHHERYDGSGYPDGLKQDEVPFNSYIIGIADAVDAMLSNRSYRKGMPITSVIRELYRNKGTQFHPELVDIMVDELSKAKMQFEKNMDCSINLSSLIISLEDDILILEGSLFSIDDYYMFKPIEESKVEEIELANFIDVEMVVKDLSTIYHYQVKIEDFADNTFYISSLQLIPSTNTFNLLWNLPGMIYHPARNKEIPIKITRIGGDALTFCLRGDIAVGIPYRKVLKFKVVFDEYDIEISGSIMRSYNFGPYKYFDVRYTNIPDNKRDAIFRQLFRRQIEIRKAINEYKY